MRTNWFLALNYWGLKLCLIAAISWACGSARHIPAATRARIINTTRDEIRNQRLDIHDVQSEYASCDEGQQTAKGFPGSEQTTPLALMDSLGKYVLEGN